MYNNYNLFLQNTINSNYESFKSNSNYNSKGTTKGTVKVQVLKVQLRKRYKGLKGKGTAPSILCTEFNSSLNTLQQV